MSGPAILAPTLLALGAALFCFGADPDPIWAAHRAVLALAALQHRRLGGPGLDLRAALRRLPAASTPGPRRSSPAWADFSRRGLDPVGALQREAGASGGRRCRQRDAAVRRAVRPGRVRRTARRTAASRCRQRLPPPAPASRWSAPPGSRPRREKCIPRRRRSPRPRRRSPASRRRAAPRSRPGPSSRRSYRAASARTARCAARIGSGSAPGRNRMPHPRQRVARGWPRRSRSARSARFRGGDRKDGHAHLLERHLARGQPGDPGAARSRLLAGLDRIRRRPRLRGLRAGPRPPCGTRRALGPFAGPQPDQDGRGDPRADARGDPPLRAQGRALCAADVLGDQGRRRADLGRRRFLPVPALRLPFADARRHADHARPLPHHPPADAGERADRSPRRAASIPTPRAAPPR